MEKLELFCDVRKGNAEGPHWDERIGDMFFVAIPEGEVHRVNPESGAHRVYSLGQECGAAVTTERGNMVVALAGGLYALNLADGALTPIADPEADLPDNRFNDAKCDPRGRLFAGTLTHGADGSASLYRLDPDGALTRVVEGVTISNGLGWSPDQTTMYYIDTPTMRVDAFDYDAETGEITNRRPLIEIPENAGVPDGMCVDAEGDLWVAMWEGHCVRHYRASGEYVDRIDLPVSRVSSCCYGGKELDTLYITTAGGPSEEEPHAGSVFRIRTGHKGLPPTRFNDAGM